MMGSGIKGPCLDCPDRNAGCHGKAEDGAWRCSRWAAYQAEQETFRAKAGGLQARGSGDGLQT